MAREEVRSEDDGAPVRKRRVAADDVLAQRAQRVEERLGHLLEGGAVEIARWLDDDDGVSLGHDPRTASGVPRVPLASAKHTAAARRPAR